MMSKIGCQQQKENKEKGQHRGGEQKGYKM